MTATINLQRITALERRQKRVSVPGREFYCFRHSCNVNHNISQLHTAENPTYVSDTNIGPKSLTKLRKTH